MSLKTLTENMLPAIENELQQVVAQLDTPRLRSFHEMLTYHMGWSGEGHGPEATGKRIRPLLVLLTCAASVKGRMKRIRQPGRGNAPCRLPPASNSSTTFPLFTMTSRMAPIFGVAD